MLFEVFVGAIGAGCFSVAFGFTGAASVAGLTECYWFGRGWFVVVDVVVVGRVSVECRKSDVERWKTWCIVHLKRVWGFIICSIVLYCIVLYCIVLYCLLNCLLN